MTERAYTLKEIDAMRQALISLTYYLYYPYGSGCGIRPFSTDSKDMFYYKKEFEEKLRTYMMAGIDPNELIKSATKHVENIKFENMYYEAIEDNVQFDLHKFQDSCDHVFKPVSDNCGFYVHTRDGKFAKYQCTKCKFAVEDRP